MNNKLEKTDFPFGMVPNSLLNNSAISLKAKGLFGYMQSKPEGWSFSEKLIASQCKESVDSVSSGLKELEAFGYLTRERKQSNKGFFIVYKLAFECGKPKVENPRQQNPRQQNPIGENPMRAKSTNNSKKDISNKEVSKKEEREGALEFLKITFPSQFEFLLMQHKSRINDFVKFSEMFEATVEQEGLVFELHVLSGRFKKFARNWIDNQDKFEGRIVSIAPKENYKSIGGGF